MLICRTFTSDLRNISSRAAGFLILAAAVAVTANIFLDKGYDVVSLDASEAMCRKTQELTGKEAVHKRIEDMNYENEFDAVWACASLLHVAKIDMHKILEKAMKALRVGGVFYASWKYGKGEQTRDDGRTFANYTEARVCDMVALVSGASLEDVWTSQDVRLDRDRSGTFVGKCSGEEDQSCHN